MKSKNVVRYLLVVALGVNLGLSLVLAQATAGVTKAPTTAVAYTALSSDHYDNAGDFYEGLAAVKIKNQWGFIDRSGTLVIAPQFNPWQGQFNGFFSDGLVAINLTSGKKSGVDGNDPVSVRWGFADHRGKIVIQPQFIGNYYSPPHFVDGLAVIGGNFVGTTVATFGLNTKYGYINKTGSFAIAQKFDEAYDFSDGLASVRIDKKYGFIDHSGKLVIAAMYDGPSFFKDGLAIVETKTGSIVIDHQNKKVLEQAYQGLSPFYEGLARFYEQGKVGFIDLQGHVKIKPQFMFSSEKNERLMYFSEGLCQFEQVKQMDEDANGRMTTKFGYFNREGKIVIEAKFDYAGPFKNGVAVVAQSGNYGYISKNGKFLIAPIFANVGYFTDGIARVSGGAAFGDYKYRFIKLSH